MAGKMKPLKMSRDGLILGAILGAAALLRFSGLARQSLWVDEVLSMRAANRILTLDAASVLYDRHGPLYFYLLAPALAVEPSELGARIPSAILGVALVGIVYLLGRDLADRSTGLAAAAVTAFSPFALWYSQEVRYVSLYLFLAAASAWSGYRFLRQPSVRDGTLHVLSTVLMLLAFPAGVFVSLAESLWALGSRPGMRKLRGWILVQGVIVLAFLPWFVRAYEIGPFASHHTPSLRETSTGFDRPLRPIQIGYPLFTFGAGLTVGPSNRELHEDLSLGPILKQGGWVFSAILITGLLAGIGSVHLLRSNAGGGCLMLLLVATSLLGPYVMAQFTQFAYNVRYTAGAVPAYLLLLGIGALWALRHRPWGWGLLAAFAVLTGFSLASYYGNPYYFRDDNRGAARFIAAKMRPGEPVIVGAEDRAFAHYFRGPLIPWTRWRVAPAGSAPADGTHTVEGRIWVAANRTWEEPPFQELLGAMQECLALETEAEFPGYRVYAFRAGGEEMERCSVTYRPSGRRAGVEPAPAAAQP